MFSDGVGVELGLKVRRWMSVVLQNDKQCVEKTIEHKFF